VGQLGQSIAFVLTGLVGGILSGLFGIGGGIVIIPMLVLLFGMNQHLAQGTTLALFVPPVGILAAWAYYREGFVDLKVAGLLCLGFFVGGFVGAKLAGLLSDILLKRVFGCTMLVIALKMIFGK
jgi:uncharacterized protein